MTTDIKKHMAEQARDIFKRDKLDTIIAGGPEKLEETIQLLVDLYPDAQRNRDVVYTFEEFVTEASTKITEAMARNVLAQTGCTASFMNAKP